MNYVNSALSEYNENTHEMLFWIENQKRNTSVEERIPQKVIDTNLVNKGQRLVYDIVEKNLNDNKQLLMIVTFQAGSGNSFAIDPLCQLLGDSCFIGSYFGTAAFNIQGPTLHSVLKLPIRSKSCNELKGNSLNQLQISLGNKKDLIVDFFFKYSENVLKD